MAADDDETQETPPEDASAEHAVPTEEATEIAGVAEDAPLEALQEAGEHAETEPADQTEPFEPVAGNAVPTEEATEIAGVAEDAPLEAAQEAVEEAVVEEIEIEAVAEAVAEEIVAEAIEAEVEEELVEALEEAVAEESIEPETGLETEEDEEIDEEPVPREKPAVPGAHLEVDIVPEGVDPLGRDTDPADPYASVAEAYDLDAESVDAGSGPHEEEEEEEEILAKPISSAAIDLASGARYRATGKRKTAIARVTLRPGTGTYLVNGRLLEEHFPRVTLQRNIRQPLETVGYQERMDVVARLHGGGISAQAGALRHGVSRALLEADPNLRGELKRRGFLTRDSRAKERKKAGLKKARKRPQFSKR
jgi:small subunit ribosomal protein S9